MLIGNLPLDLEDDDLIQLFETIGKVQSVEILRDKSGRGRGFAFVTMRDQKEKEQALRVFHNAEFRGRVLTLTPANLSAPKSRGFLFDIFRFG
jgi:RNA recognition motif-containing protein